MSHQRIFKAIIMLYFILNNYNVNAQVRSKIFKDSIPQQLLPIANIFNKIIELAPPTEFLNLKNAALVDGDNRFASSLPVNIDFIKNATVISDKKYRIYVLKLHALGALNISLQFDGFFLVEKAILSIYTDKELTDSITSSQNNPNNIWATRIYQGSYVNIVLKEDINQIEQSQIKISKIGFGYKKYGPEFGNIGASAPCNVNVACPAGNPWNEERNSVALIVANLETLCSGALIMNTCNTNIPFLLTADHCLAVGDVPNWVFQFQTWSTTCIGNNGWVEDVQFNGCQLRANNAATDFALLQLNQTPPPNSGIRYAGWSRLTPINGGNITNTTILHHPKGDLMKISVDNNAPTQTTFNGVNGWLLNLDLGATEGGSSGAPYFNQVHRIIGQHYGITQNAPACENPPKLGGRFDLSWTGGGTNATRLSNWLDPSGSNATTTNTTNISNLHNPIGTTFLFVIGPDNFCTGTGQYSLPNLPANASVSWSSSNTSVATISPSGNTATLTMVNEGMVTITATISQCGATPVVRAKTVTMGFPYFSNPVNGADTATPYGHYTFTQPLPWSYPTGSYFWRVPTGWTLLFGQGTNTIYVQAGGMGEGGPVEVDVTACGLTRLNHKYVEIGYSNCNGCIPDRVGLPDEKQKYKLKIMPNPAHDNVTVSLIADVKLTDNSYSILQVTITDKMGSIKKQLKFSNRQLSQNINISGLPTDVYVVSVYDGHSWKKAKLIVQ